MANLLDNKKVRFNYEILDTFDAGIELYGNEVKSLRAKHGSLDGSHITVRGGEAYLIGCTIPPYQPSNTAKDYNPERNRRLLLTKDELTELGSIEAKKGLTIVPISVYNKGRNLKIQIGIARGKKAFDKRETTKSREVNREVRREMKYEN